LRGEVQATLTDERSPVATSATSSDDARGSRAAAALGTAMGIATAAIYFIGANRSLGDVDGSVTVGAFVKTRSLADPLRRTLNIPGFRFNNHPLFSLIEHAVWSSGLHSAAALRVAPILFGAAAVGLLAWECARRFGLLAGACAGAVLAVNPFFAFLSRELRDYSLIVLCAVASTILLVRLLEAERPRTAMRVGYVLIVAAALASHLWFGPVLLAHVAIVFAQRRLSGRWILQWLVAVVLGLAIYVQLAGDMLHGQKNGFSNLGFPSKTAHVVLGHELIAVAIFGGFVAYALALYFRTRAVFFPVLAVGAFIGLVWLVLQPQGLGPRYVVWLIPVVGLAVAVVVARRPWAALLVAVAVLAMVADQAASWTSSSPDIARAAAIVDAARAQGLRVCGYKAGQWAVLAYTKSPPYLPPEGIAGCDVIVAMKYPKTNLDDTIQAQFPVKWEEKGKTPIVVYAREPIRAIVFPPPGLSLDTHLRTYP
jgi:hypothetical protein